MHKAKTNGASRAPLFFFRLMLMRFKIDTGHGGSMNFGRNSIYNSVGVTKVLLSLLIPLVS